MKKLILAALFVCATAATLCAGETPSPALLVLSKADHTLAIVDPATLKVVAKIPSGEDPHEVIASADGKLAYISNYGFGAFNTISVADLVGQKALPAIQLGALRGPHGLDFVDGELYFTAEVNKVFGRYDPATQKIDWIMGTGQDRTHMVLVGKTLDRIYTSNVNSGTISIFEKTAAPARRGPPPAAGRSGPPPPPPEANWEETVLETGLGTEGFDESPDGRELWSAAAEDGTISVIDLAAKEVVARIQANVARANRVKFTPDGKYVFVSMLGGANGNLAIFDAATRREVKRMNLGRGAGGILMQPDGRRAYLACSPDDYVAVIDLKTLEAVGRIEAGGNPDGLAWAERK
jgi:YVTN family beta-propeller protein